MFFLKNLENDISLWVLMKLSSEKNIPLIK